MIALVAAAILDVVLANGRVLDGTGAPWFRADVGIRGDRIAAVGDLSHVKARRRVDLRGLTVSPGFIDMLGQSEFNLLVDNRAESKIRQGITSELTGEGISPAPMNATWIQESKGWLDRYHVRVDWRDLAGYWKRLRRARPAINVGVLVGAGQVRGVVLGLGDVQPDDAQLLQMQALVETAMKQGALGVSTGLIYPPGAYARTPELVALAKAAAKHGGLYATHLRSEGKQIAPALEEAFTIAREARIPVEIWHLKVSGKSNWGRMKEVTDLIEGARVSGLDVTADVYPYVASANNLDASIPDWAHAGGTDAMLARLRDPKDRARILAELPREGFAPDTILLLSALNPELKPFMGRRLPDVARELGKTPEEAMLDLVVRDRANIGVARFGMSEEDVQLAMQKPWVSFDLDYGERGLDGPFAAEGSAHPRAFGTMPRVLGHYVRELHLLTLEEAVRKMTSLPARRLNLQDRGLLRVGMKADLAVFDPETIRDVATFEKPLAYAEGVVHVLVNGRFVLDAGKLTSERPGVALTRGARPAR